MEGPLVSDTTELLSGAVPASEDSPIGHSAARSAGAAAASRPQGRDGADLSKLLVPDLQRIAQQLGISGTGRMRKGDLIAAINERQGGGRSSGRSTPAGSAATGERAAKSPEVSATRVASAGVGASRPLNQDAMEADTSVRSGVGDAAHGGGVGEMPRSAGTSGIGESQARAAAAQQPASTAQPAGTQAGSDGLGQGAGQDGRRTDRRRTNGRRDDQGANGRDQRRDGRDQAVSSGGRGSAGGQNSQSSGQSSSQSSGQSSPSSSQTPV